MKKKILYKIITKIILLIIIIILIAYRVIDKKLLNVSTQNLVLENDKNLEQEQSNKNLITDVKKTKMNNSEYLSLEQDDPNAEDVSVISKDINELVTGRRNYPVRVDGKKVVYLTFDDGPSTTNTPQILKVLEKYNIKGTFCVLETSIDKNNDTKKY